MIGILIRKLTGLGRDENGAALMVTLALFLLMYLSGAGVFAIGKVVKDRVHLQNACDAAAYSAAVVQADTLSRIATINRAMAWTYVSMTLRQMDYIVYKWLEETCKHHKKDEEAAKDFARDNCSLHNIPGRDWGITTITLNGHIGNKSRDYLEEEYRDNLPASMSACSKSFYSRGTRLSDLGRQIDDDLATLQAMNISVGNLASLLPNRVDKIVKNVLSANIPSVRDAKSDETYVFKIIQNENPTAGRENDSGSGYLMDIHNTANGELRFLRFYTNAVSSAAVFNKGIDDWFERSDANEPGIRRSYKYGKSGALYAEWSWWSQKWLCSGVSHTLMEHADWTTCTHKHDHNRCFCSNDKNWSINHIINAKCHADNNSSWDNRFASKLNGKEVYARPLVLRDSYFGEAGTITVGLAKYNENPWYRILKTKTDAAGILKGIFAAFNPYKYMEWTWAFSSAKAGYKYKGDEEKDGEKRKYRIDWREGNQSWNLCQSDWDAVFVPVRRAVSQAKDGEWIDSNVPELGKWITDEDGWKKLSGSSTVSYKVGDMPALPGMDWNEDGDTDWSIAGDDERGRYSGLNWYQEAALIRDSDGAGGNMLWNRLAEMLYH